MRPVESTFLRRSLAFACVTAFTVGLGGCAWHDGSRRGWGWNDHNDPNGHDDDRGRGRGNGKGHDKHHDHDNDD